MIGRIQGRLTGIEGNFAQVVIGDPQFGCLTYDVMLPAFTALRLQASVGQNVTLLTYHFVESVGQGTTLIPRLAGFLSQADRDFFELFTTCKGVGNKRALRAMTMEPAAIAAAIADRDVKLLQTLPEIGKRMAETVVATLHGKVNEFLSVVPAGKAAASSSGKTPAGGTLAHQALEVLLQLGEQRANVTVWIDQVLRDSDDRPSDVQELVARVYRLKAGGKG